MAGSVNKVILIGHLGKDPEIRTLNSGDRVANLSIATSESWRDKVSGDRKERTEWHRVVIFNDGLAGIAERYLKKGHKVYVEGQLATRKWTDQQGIEKYATEIVLKAFNGTLTLLERSQNGPDDYGTTSGGYDPQSQYTGGSDARGRDSGRDPASPQNFDLDDEIPF
ncbi:single-stranded DNA-binding protein [Asticcacaulis sp. ZE23SCel15]|uniref:single-stranded DNA-binding protein n=1 Tax=Asticcacaulis sp. ZE23SCel15 TaxID=3059027 RepID=UPI00265DE02E|nr:single-stranded DNA-binding protein [Asticcacaulis sp. ZE23SCel15]WKL57270.1 single-stranded DNA-binding protein [Asticcacaulis sp. ZE23SCel15]